jgi:hypothetical protein
MKLPLSPLGIIGIALLLLGVVIFLLPQPAPEPTTVPIPTTCTDSDEGFEEYVAGSVQVGEAVYVDECYGPFDATHGHDHLREYFCENGNVQEEEVDCANRCKNGACLPETFATCVDYDQGKNAQYSSTVCITQVDGVAVCTQDVCDGDRVIEYYCNNNRSSVERIECEFGCSRGACLPNPTQ